MNRMRITPYPAGFGVAAVVAICATFAARAEDFSWQIAGGVSSASFVGPGESHVTTLAATYYLDPVNDAAGPLSLASFLSPKSLISVSASRVNGPDSALKSDLRVLRSRTIQPTSR